MSLQSINPATGITIQSFPTWQAEEINIVLGLVDSAQTGWAELDIEQRSILHAKPGPDFPSALRRIRQPDHR